MSLTIVSFANYLTKSGSHWRPEDWAAYSFVQAIKGKPFKGYADIPVNGTRLRLDQTNAKQAAAWFGIMASDCITHFELPRPLFFVPVPNSSCAAGANQLPRTFFQAQEVVRRLPNTSVLDCLRWKHVMPSASKAGGSRDPQFLYGNLVIVGALPNPSVLILIDDVKTSGGHLRAAQAMLLTQAGVECQLAFCAARTVHLQYPEVFTTEGEEINNWSPAQTLF